MLISLAIRTWYIIVYLSCNFLQWPASPWRLPVTQNSFTYFGFLFFGVVVFYLLSKKLRRFWLFFLSAAFYWFCAPDFLWLLAATIVINYSLGRWISSARKGKALLISGLCLNLGVLALFKYLGFFGDILSVFGTKPLRLSVLALPLGISFYEFVCCGYLIDVYRGTQEAERSVVDFALFVSFFPAILSGPIARAAHFLPQLKKQSIASGGGGTLRIRCKPINYWTVQKSFTGRYAGHHR